MYTRMRNKTDPEALRRRINTTKIIGETSINQTKRVGSNAKTAISFCNVKARA
jgi:predicted pyridoxine 5'-phosphate oxidase superfamily flavin-nucleotide-binding protein